MVSHTELLITGTVTSCRTLGKGPSANREREGVNFEQGRVRDEKPWTLVERVSSRTVPPSYAVFPYLRTIVPIP